MKILLIDNTSLTPLGNNLCCEPKTGGFATELQSLGNKITMYGQIVEDKNNIHSFDIMGNGISVVGYFRKNNKLINYFFLYLMVIPQVLKNDFIYIFYPSAFKYVAILCWLMNKPYGLYVRGENDLKTKTSKFIFKKSNVVFTVGDFFTTYIKERTLKKNVFSIKPMINLTPSDIVYDRNTYLGEKIKILFLARIEKDKGIEEFLYAISELMSKFELEVDIVGDGSMLCSAKKLSRELGIDQALNFHGAIFDEQAIKSFFMNSNLYVLPTYHEGFPRTLYESMIFGTPILTTFVGGISSVMINRYNCIEIEPQSIKSITDGVIYAVSNYSVMQQYAKNGISTVKPIIAYSRKNHAQHLNSLINKFH